MHIIFERACFFGGMVINTWLLTVLNYFKFVGDRKPTQKFGILPDLKLLCAVLLSVFVVVLALYNFADPIFIKWYAEGNTDRAGLFALTTDIGQSHWILISSGSIILFMSIYNFPKLSSPHTIHWHHIFLKFYFVFTTIAFSGLAAILFKNLIGRARPVLHENYELWLSSPFAGVYHYASFPSGHSTTVGALAAVLLLIAPRIGYVFVPVAIWVAISRVAVGAHFPSDIIAGLSLGVIFTWIYARSFARKRLLFEFGENGEIKLRNLAAKRARRKIRRREQSLGDLGFGAIAGPRAAKKA
ncbi:MAG: phosphatase PAP2 family protein [Pseudomonadota bacterium]